MLAAGFSTLFSSQSKRRKRIDFSELRGCHFVVGKWGAACLHTVCMLLTRPITVNMSLYCMTSLCRDLSQYITFTLWACFCLFFLDTCLGFYWHLHLQHIVFLQKMLWYKLGSTVGDNLRLMTLSIDVLICRLKKMDLKHLKFKSDHSRATTNHCAVQWIEDQWSTSMKYF